MSNFSSESEHYMTAQLLWHVQNKKFIGSLYFTRGWCIFTKKKDYKLINHLWNGIDSINISVINALWPHDALWQQRSGSTLPQVMVLCRHARWHQAIAHYQNQCWLIISTVLWYSSEGIMIRRSENTNQWSKTENGNLKIASWSPRDQWVQMFLGPTWIIVIILLLFFLACLSLFLLFCLKSQHLMSRCGQVALIAL